ncbi:MAG: ferredoxin [Candidatus Accumulibacter sp.]|jgi:ferredoxin|nr:ferredoxin [Accumulibacter sp.]
MEADLQANVAFFLSGKANTPNLEVIDRLNLRPALFASYRDLTRLRYDFPLVLVAEPAGGACIESLSGLIDGILDKIAHGDDAGRIRKHLLRLERHIRAQAAAGKGGKLSALWDKAARDLGKSDKAIAESLAQARANLKVDGDVVDCDGAMPCQLIGHAWTLTQASRARRFGEIADRLIVKLSDILRADFANSNAGRSADNLRQTFGSGPLDKFDFDAMSKLLSRSVPKENLGKSRRKRIEWLLATLKTQQFYPSSHSTSQPYSFAFDSCGDAIRAYRERLPKAIELAKAVAIGELEVRGEYSEAKHDRLFESFGENGLDPREMAIFPDYLARVHAHQLPGGELGALTEIMSLNLPIKVLVQSDDIIEESPIGNGHLAFALRNRQLARMALGMVGVFVVQAPASALYRVREKIVRGLDCSGPALFSIFSGVVKGKGQLPPYLIGAAALESRVFPVFTMDPTAGNDWASRFSLAANPQADLDWPIHCVAYQDENCQSVVEDHPFTLIDFVACDARYGKFFAAVAKPHWQNGLAEASGVIDNVERGDIHCIDSVPSLLMVAPDNRLQKVIVVEKIVREARRCLSMWHSLQELGGIHNSHAEKLLAREKAAWEASGAAIATAATPPIPDPAVTPPAPDSAPTADAAFPEKEPETSTDEAYIETPRCASCNECIQISAKIFAYNDNKQAYVKDAGAGTYAQLVEAAENCQVAIIHPGKPRNASEPGLDELMKRAEAFA